MYKTSTLNIAAALISEGYRLNGSEPGDKPKQKIFIIDCTPEEGDKFAVDYLNGDLMVNLKAFSDAIRTLKSYLYDY